MRWTRRRATTLTLTVGLAWVLCGLVDTYAQSLTVWRTYMDAGYDAQQHTQYVKAERLYQLALQEAEEFGPHHLNVADSLTKLGELYRMQAQYAKAEPRLRRALQIREKALGRDHPTVALSLSKLGELYRLQGRYAEAESILERALSIRQKVLGLDHADVAASFMTLARLYENQ